MYLVMQFAHTNINSLMVLSHVIFCTEWP